MKATIPFHYTVAYVPKRHINKHTVYFASEGEVEFRPVSRMAVRPVLRLGKKRKNAEKNWTLKNPYTFKDDGSLREIVQFENDLWVEAVPVADVVAGLEARGGEGTPFEDMRLLQDISPKQYGQTTRIYESQHQVEMTQRLPMRTFENDNGDRVRRSLKKRSDAFIEIDGILYARCREPLLTIGGRYDDKMVDFCRPHRGLSSGSSADRTYAYDDDTYVFDEDVARMWSMLEEGAGREEFAKSDNTALETFASFEILDPEVLTLCPHIDVFLHLSDLALHALWENPLALRTDLIDVAVEMRDAMAACGGQITPRLLRAVREVSRIQPMAADEVGLWQARAAGRPRMVTYNGSYHHGNDTPLTRASQIVAHAGNYAKAVEHASAALRRYELRAPRISWEERAVEAGQFHGDHCASYELLSSQIVAQHAENLRFDPSELLRAARNDGARIFAVGNDVEGRSPSFVALVDVNDGPSIRDIFHADGSPPSENNLSLLKRHLEAAFPGPEAVIETSPAFGMSP